MSTRTLSHSFLACLTLTSLTVWPLASQAKSAKPADTSSENKSENKGENKSTRPEAPKPPTATPAVNVYPAYKNLRYEENWAVIKDQPAHDYLDPLKYIALDKQGLFSLTFAGNLRLRGEGWSNFNFDPAADGIFGLSQLRLSADLHATDYFRLYLEGISALSTPRSLPGGNRTIDVDALDFQNLFVDLKLPLAPNTYVLLRPGRQELDYGKQRLMSSLVWVNTRRTFDAVRAIGAWNGLRVDAFYAQPVPVTAYGLNLSSPDNSVYGAYGTMPIGDALSADLYWLGLHKTTTAYQGVSGSENRQTLGARLGGKLPLDLDAELEGAWQFGSFADQTISAGFVASELGYSPNALAGFGKPRFLIGVDYASGDGNRSDKQLNTFNQLYPLAHAYYGYADMLARENAVDLMAGFALNPLPQLGVSFKAHQFMRASTTDDIYGTGGGVFRSGDKGSSAGIGTELDLVATYKLDQHIGFEGGYCHIFPGAFIAESGASDNLDFTYLSTNYTF